MEYWEEGGRKGEGKEGERERERKREGERERGGGGRGLIPHSVQSLSTHVPLDRMLMARADPITSCMWTTTILKHVLR